MTKYMDALIKPCSSGFGEYATELHNGEAWDDVNDLLAEIRGNCDGDIVELVGDIDSFQVPDIRGRIRGEPARVFVVLPWRAADYIWYFGICEV